MITARLKPCPFKAKTSTAAVPFKAEEKHEGGITRMGSLACGANCGPSAG